MLPWPSTLCDRYRVWIGRIATVFFPAFWVGMLIINGQGALGGRGSVRIGQEELKTPSLEGAFIPESTRRETALRLGHAAAGRRLPARYWPAQSSTCAAR